MRLHLIQCLTKVVLVIFIGPPIFLLAGLSYADTFFVNSRATCPGEGSQSNPYRNLTTAVTEAARSDVIIVQGGSYPENLIIPKRLTITASSSPAIIGRYKAKVVNMIPSSLSRETGQDSEPFIAVDGSDSQRMVGTAFTPNPAGTGTGLAPIYVSTDGGDTWVLRMIVPSAGQLGTGDITVATTQVGNRLFGGILRVPGSLLLNTLRTANFVTGGPMAVLNTRRPVDQPFVQATTAGGTDRVYIGNNNLGVQSGRTATVDVSLNGGTTFNSIGIESRGTSGQNGPSIRPTISRDGTVYAAYFGWRNFTGSGRSGTATSDVVVVRDDSGATGPNPFQDLIDPVDNLPGRLVVQNVTIPWSNAQTLGFERIGSSLSIAVDPNNSAIVHVAWADRVGTGDIYTIHVRRSINRGGTWSNDLRTVINATPFALTVASNGTVGFLYQQFVGSGVKSRWVTHFEQTTDAFVTINDSILSSFPGNAPAIQFLPYIGDYNGLVSAGNVFHGIFSASNTPNLCNFPNGVQYQRFADFPRSTLLDRRGNAVNVSIDPFYFEIAAID